MDLRSMCVRGCVARFLLLVEDESEVELLLVDL